jgi:hypothetical protein
MQLPRPLETADFSFSLVLNLGERSRGDINNHVENRSRNIKWEEVRDVSQEIGDEDEALLRGGRRCCLRPSHAVFHVQGETE